MDRRYGRRSGELTLIKSGAKLLTSVRKLSRRQAALVAGLTAVVGVAVVVAIFASGSPTAFEPESGTLTSPAAVVSDAGASGGHAVKFGSGASGCTPVTDVPAGFPNNCTTGYKSAPDYPGSLHSCGAIQSNNTYNFCDYPGQTSITATNVTFHGCRFHGTEVNQALVILHGDNLTFDYTSFEPDQPFVHNTQVPFDSSYQYGLEADGGYGSSIQKLTVTHSDFWGFGNAVDVAGSTQAKPQVFRDNWVHDPSNDGLPNPGNYHTDGIGNESGHGTGSYLVIDHNTIVSPGNTNGIAFQQGTYDHYTLTNNLFGGYGMTVALIGSTYTTFTNNTYTTLLKPVWGPLYGANFWTSTGSVWARNKWLVPAGAAWGTPANSGKYWLPCTYTIDSQVRDDWYTSTTDYDGVNLPAACH